MDIEGLLITLKTHNGSEITRLISKFTETLVSKESEQFKHHEPGYHQNRFKIQVQAKVEKVNDLGNPFSDDTFISLTSKDIY